MTAVICLINTILENMLAIISMVLSFITLIMAIYIPRKIRVDQGFSALSEQYRSPEMGFAVLSIFHFYSVDCENNPELIKEKYIERYKKEVEKELEKPAEATKIINPALTLQFQRRLVTYFYWDLAKLYVDSKWPRLTKKQIKQFVETNERNLISLVLQMSEANAECFTKYENIVEPSNDDVPMNQMLKRLYYSTEDL